MNYQYSVVFWQDEYKYDIINNKIALPLIASLWLFLLIHIYFFTEKYDIGV